MNYILFDDYSWENLLPLTFTRPVSEIRMGILTIREKWEKRLQTTCSYLTQDYLAEKYPLKTESQNILINGAVVPGREMVNYLHQLTNNQALVYRNEIIAARLTEEKIDDFYDKKLRDIDIIELQNENIVKLNYPWEIFKYNGKAIEEDLSLITENRESKTLSSTNNLLGENPIFLEPGAKVEFATLNTTFGPIYIGKNAEIMEGSVIRGGMALCENAVLKMGTRIYGPTTIGPECKVGGEVNNSVLFAFTNKGHDGFLGNSVLGEWCNLGADTNNSNLKNNYATVKMWNYAEEKFIDTHQQYCGLIMGDHCKCGINTMFNTGTVIGVNANIFGEGFPRNFVPSFSWGGAKGFKEYQPDKAFDVANRVMEKKNKSLDDKEKEILREIFQRTGKFRQF